MAKKDGSEFHAALIRSYVDVLISPLGGVKPAIATSHAELRSMHRAGDHAGIVGFVSKSMKLNTRIRLGRVNSGGPPGVPVWIEMPAKVAPFGSSQFADTTFTLYARKSFLRDASFEVIVAVTAHSMARIVLASIGNRLRDRDKAVALAAMILGYRDFFLDGSKKSESNSGVFDLLQDILREIAGGGSDRYSVYGYLTPEETRFASQIIEQKYRKQ